MTLQGIAETSNYVTDEEITNANLLGSANAGISEVNAYCGCLLPLFTEDSLTDATAYTALMDTWQIRLLEPYYAYSIAANDGDTNARDFHYNRFLKAMDQFKGASSGSGGMSDLDEDYQGGSERMKKIDVSDVTVHWEGWV